MSVNMNVFLTRHETQVLADYWLNIYETLEEEEYNDDKTRNLVVERLDHYEILLEDLIDDETPIQQLERL